MISNKALLLYQKVGSMAPLPPSPCARTLFTYLQYISYLYSCANIIAKLIIKAKAMAIIQN